MQTVLTRRLVGLVALAGLTVCGCSSPKVETREEMLRRALNDKDLPDSAAIMLIGQATFRGGHFADLERLGSGQERCVERQAVRSTAARQYAALHPLREQCWR